MAEIEINKANSNCPIAELPVVPEKRLSWLGQIYYESLAPDPGSDTEGWETLDSFVHLYSCSQLHYGHIHLGVNVGKLYNLFMIFFIKRQRISLCHTPSILYIIICFTIFLPRPISPQHLHVYRVSQKKQNGGFSVPCELKMPYFSYIIRQNIFCRREWYQDH